MAKIDGTPDKTLVLGTPPEVEGPKATAQGNQGKKTLLGIGGQAPRVAASEVAPDERDKTKALQEQVAKGVIPASTPNPTTPTAAPERVIIKEFPLPVQNEPVISVVSPQSAWASGPNITVLKMQRDGLLPSSLAPRQSDPTVRVVGSSNGGSGMSERTKNVLTGLIAVVSFIAPLSIYFAFKAPKSSDVSFSATPSATISSNTTATVPTAIPTTTSISTATAFPSTSSSTVVMPAPSSDADRQDLDAGATSIDAGKKPIGISKPLIPAARLPNATPKPKESAASPQSTGNGQPIAEPPKKFNPTGI